MRLEYHLRGLFTRPKFGRDNPPFHNVLARSIHFDHALSSPPPRGYTYTPSIDHRHDVQHEFTAKYTPKKVLDGPKEVV